jgi:hypothetical protein
MQIEAEVSAAEPAANSDGNDEAINEETDEADEDAS